jgi:hypothetical protein
VVVNGKKILSDEYAISIKANIKEDFSKMSVEERQQAPILEYTPAINFGTIKAGKKVPTKFTLSNVGVNPLIIRRAFIIDEAITLSAPKTIKGGKKADLKVELNTQNMKVGNYSRVITVITNDPTHSVVRLTINWTIE